MKKKLTFIILLSLSIFKTASAQNWGGGIDDESFNFGFSFQYIAAEYKVIKTPNWREPYYADSERITNPLNSISSIVTPGFSVGLVVNKNINSNVDFRFTPAIVFSDRKMVYVYDGPLLNDSDRDTEQKTTKATMVDFPMSMKLKSDRLMNFRTYVMAGLKYSVDLASKKRTRNDDIQDEMAKNLRNKRNFLSYEAGLGMDFYFEWFKMSPEFKVSYSFKDIINHEGTAFDTPIDKAKLRHFTFSLFFE